MHRQDQPQHYLRSSDLVHRVLDDRVIVRRVGHHGASATGELVGAAGIVWIAADEPTSNEAIVSATGLSHEMVTDAVRLLVEGRWLTRC